MNQDSRVVPSYSVLNVKAVVAAFNQEKALVGAFSVITNLRVELFEALLATPHFGCEYLVLAAWRRPTGRELCKCYEG